MVWLRPCLSIDPRERPTVHELLQTRFFLKVSAANTLDIHAAANQI